MNSLLIVTEGENRLKYRLDKKREWLIGRPYEDNRPDIELHDKSVSRRQGRFQNIDGVWFYLDNNRGNGSYHNGKRIKAGINGRIRPVMLENGDVLSFGCKKTEEGLVAAVQAEYLENCEERIQVRD